MALLYTCAIIQCLSHVASGTNADDGNEDVLNTLLSTLDVNDLVAAAKEVRS